MKKCPTCNQIYDISENFCANEGSILIIEQNLGHIPLNQQFSSETLTQVVSHQHAVSPNVTPNNSKGLYALIVGLVVIILAMGMGFLMLQWQNVTENAANTQNSNLNQNSEIYSKLSETTKPEKTFISSDNTQPVSNLPVSNPPVSNKPANKSAIIKSVAVSAMARKFRRTYQGTIDNDGIEMYLVRNGSSLSGKVYSRNAAADISVEGYIENDGTFEMAEKSDIGVVTGIYSGQIQPDNTISGTWSKPNGEKSRPLYLRGQ